MKKLNLSYFYYFKRNYSWIGHFWQDRYKSKPVGKDRYFIQCGKYIELNPVRANIVKKPENYSFSSYNHYAKGVKDKLITEDFFYQDLAKNQLQRQRAYQELVIADVVTDTYTKPVWGAKEQIYNEARKMRYHLKRRL